MDIQVPKPVRQPFFKRHRGLGVIVCLLVIWLLVQLDIGLATQLPKSDIMIATVKQGVLNIEVDAFGELQSEQQHIITTTSAGIVTEVVNKAGSIVEAGTLIAKLENPDLTLELKRSQQRLIEAKADELQLNLRQQRERLLEQSVLGQLEGELATLTFRFQAQKNLVDRGIISELSFLETQAQLGSLETRVSHAKARIEQLQGLHLSATALALEKIELAKQEQALLAEKVAQLDIVAAEQGVIEVMPLELGARVERGAHVVTIGSQHALKAELKVNQSQAANVQVGQLVKVFSAAQVIRGKVTRIDPVITAHHVIVEVSLPLLSDIELRPKQSIRASIVVDTIDDAFYVQNPVGEAAKMATLYRVLDGGKTELVDVQFGQKSGRYIEVKGGLKVGDSIVISDLSSYAQQAQAVVIQ
ncbi:efflux RND transporter periplasmic adaptor subunit [Pseudoalteromonas obscura]|uniref:HlyD family efflux transporter periplasmic adaptor subunit n=1 Tax=Pseudoalteromonas obscura TaxID=3048491 RepID=A0ABT7ET55_9GAMM|nr:HlyD family efflux transporter periplasmic adaptor subunit [Pseudoalteromonas sp. P94(2023)]MDK2598217.1 HlyD family efflux transporter periplasmic adaptor subunit [Pseudoalteromonas sp. P94(2023)]